MSYDTTSHARMAHFYCTACTQGEKCVRVGCPGFVAPTRPLPEHVKARRTRIALAVDAQVFGRRWEREMRKRMAWAG